MRQIEKKTVRQIEKERVRQIEKKSEKQGEIERHTHTEKVKHVIVQSISTIAKSIAVFPSLPLYIILCFQCMPAKKRSSLSASLSILQKIRFYIFVKWLYSIGTLFTIFHFLRKLQIGPRSQSVEQTRLASAKHSSLIGLF